MTSEQLRPIFEKKYNRSEWYDVLKGNFNVTTLFEKPVDITHRVKSNPYDAKAWELGSFTTLDGHLVGMYEVEVKEKSDITRNRKGLRNLLSQVYSTDVEAALLVFIQGNKWRFSYVSEITVKNKETGKREKKTTDPKRYTYLLGEGERAKTAADRFATTKKSEDLFGGGVTLHALEEAFNVEKMSKAFFNEYRKQYGKFVSHLIGEDENGKKTGRAINGFASFFPGEAEQAKKNARDFIKKMLGRIVFLYFLEKKGWLGVPDGKKWGDGDENFLSNLFNDCKEKDGFYTDILVPLFFATLNTERKEEHFRIDQHLFTKPGYNKLKIPYLNGGLFEEDETATQFLVFKKKLFEDLFTFFDQYNFTVYEDSPDEHTVAVDPEMLGHIFENLLEDNKDKGAFYTPKEIVHYMCRESLIEYLYTKLNPQLTESYTELGKQQAALFGNADKKGQLSLEQKNNTAKELVTRTAIEKLVLQHEAADIIEYDEAILKALKEVKICDPAIGSGAFPMGLLMEIFHLVETLYYASPDVTADVWKFKKGWEPAKVKEEIIQNSIYGVDIEKGAVDIARLRFWLSLVVEEDIPKPLPNLDYKIVVGNSLLSKFEDEVIDIDWSLNSAKATEATRVIITQQAANLNTLQSWQTAYFYQKGNKHKQQKEIRDKKIDIICNQLTLSKISFQQNNPKLGGFAPTAKEIQRNLENEIKQATFDKTIKQLQVLKKDKTSTLNFFDWKLDFPEVMNEKVARGDAGFDIVIGNPPYGAKLTEDEKKFLLSEYETAKSIKGVQKGSLDTFSLFIELGFKILSKDSNLHFIVPISVTSSDSMTGIHKMIEANCDVIKISSYSVRPQPVFENAVVNTSIIFLKRTNTECKNLYLTKMHRKSIDFNLESLVNNLQFVNVLDYKIRGRYPKISLDIERSILRKIFDADMPLINLMKDDGLPIYYRTTGGRYFKIITNYSTGSTQEKSILFEKKYANSIGAILSSSLYFWWYQIFSDNLHIKSYEIESFKIPLNKLEQDIIKSLEDIFTHYLKDVEGNVKIRQTNKYANIGSFKEYKIGKSKKWIDKIDDLIGPLYGFSKLEIEFIKNYEINFRMQEESID